jgi:hypothetical protein
MHDQMTLRARCFQLIEVPGRPWPPVPGEDTLCFESWLFIEDYCIISVAGFEKARTNAGEIFWAWNWAFIDSEHRRKGYLSKRLGLWAERYKPTLVVDAPNEDAVAMLRKAGYAERFLIQPSAWQVDIKGTAGDGNPVMSLDDYERRFLLGQERHEASAIECALQHAEKKGHIMIAGAQSKPILAHPSAKFNAASLAFRRLPLCSARLRDVLHTSTA